MRDVSQSELPGIAEFRAFMARFTTGVCVVAVPHGDSDAGDLGDMSAMTVNSLVSVSLDPMLIGWSLQNASSQFDLYAGADAFSVSILGADQADLAIRYASRGDSRMQRDDFVTASGGLPVLAQALGHIECTRWSTYKAGDHTMIFGEVTGLGGDGEAQRSPLCFYEGQFVPIAR